MAILTLVAVLLVLVVGPVVLVNRDLIFKRATAKRATREAALPFLIFPVSSDAPRIVPWGALKSEAPSAERSVPEPQTVDVAAAEPTLPSSPRVPSVPVDHTDAGETGPANASLAAAQREERRSDVTPLSAQSRWALATARATVPDDEPSPDATIVFNRPVDEPVQILPGRLRILSGESPGGDLRLFNRLGERPQIVVGRETGPPHQHITLRSPTVSRRHARMEFVDGCWTITNLSATNPVLVNDRALVQTGATRKLADGDRIELGEVALRFLAS
ncbi:MAG: FHA domain-containing protein [Gemmatimonadota bacterium]|nr:FHA domain-containing protein [Gemmatimonadota bacterium]